MSTFSIAPCIRAFICLSVALTLISFQAANAQHHLHRPMSLGPISDQPLIAILESISSEGGFHFTFNGDRVPTDSLISMPAFSGTVSQFLERILGEQYNFREVGDYVIIRHVPLRFAPTVAMNTTYRGTLIVEGQIKDAATHQGVPHVSVYDKYSYASTLSDADGRFQLTIKQPDESLWVEISKDNYRDTLIVMLMPVDVRQRDHPFRFKYFPGQEQENALAETWLGRLLISSRSRIQHLNIGNFFAERFYQLSIVPGVGIQGDNHSRTVNKLSMNILGGYGAGVDGVEVSGLYGINQHDVGNIQVAGIFNLTGGKQSGIQLAGVFNQVIGSVHGVQVSSVYNTAKSIHGTQIGLINVADSSDYPIGLLNLVGNGTRSITLEADENMRISANLRTGGRVLYGVLGVGYGIGKEAQLTYGIRAGLGAHLLRHQAFSVDMEFVNSSYTDFSTLQSQYSLALHPQIKLNDRLSLVVAPALHLTTGYENSITDQPRWSFSPNPSNRSVVLHGGVAAGIRYDLGTNTSKKK